MLVKTKDVHKQFAYYFDDKNLTPYLYLLSKKLSEGSICLDLNQIDLNDLKEAGFDKLPPVWELKKQDLVSFGSEWKPFVFSNDHLYLQRYFQYETNVLNIIKTLVTESDPAIEKSLLEKRELIQTLFAGNKTGNTDWQMVAAISAVLNRFTIITGGPGTGKTTTVAKILMLLFTLNPGLKVALAAPTGKAAARMAESLKSSLAGNPHIDLDLETLVPSTIHRLLGPIKNSIYFKHNARNPIAYDLVIVDEASMIDIALFSKLLEALKPSSRIIFLGDKNQLASVEAGSLLGDLCMSQPRLNLFSAKRAELINRFAKDESSKIKPENIGESAHPLFGHIVELQHSYRFSDEGGIGKLSRAIIGNHQEEVQAFFKISDPQVEIDLKNSREIFENFVMGYQEYIQEADLKLAFAKLKQLRILCAVREGPEGVVNINHGVEMFLRTKKILNPQDAFYENRPVIVTANNRELGLFNGDVGITRRDKNGTLKVYFEMPDGEIKGVLPAFINSCETVFAMTIHKSQGSEFERVLTILPDQPDLPLLTRELLYTAVTRAKKKVVIQSEEKTLLVSIKREVQRGSGIIDRFANME